jgi:O-antigen/teichoic acid export membrane protein
MIISEIKFLLAHSSIYGLGTMISRIASLILLPLYTRYLTPSDYGILSTVEITTGLMGIVITMGIALALSRFFYESDNTKDRNMVVSTSYIVYSTVAVIFLPLLLLSAKPFSLILFNTIDYKNLFIIGFLTLILQGLSDIGIMYLRLIKKSALFIFITISRLIIIISLNIIFIMHFKMGIIGILYSSLIASIFYGLIMSTVILWRSKIRYSHQLAIEMLKYSMPIIPSRLAETMVKQSDKYFVLHFFSTAQLGIYSLSLKLGNTIHDLLTVPFNMAYIPRRFEIMKRDDAKNIYAKIFTYYMFLMIICGLTISLFVPEILSVLVTPEFFGANQYIPLVVLTMIIFGSHRHLEFGILFSKKTKFLAYINITTSSLNLLLNYILIRNFAVWGALISLITAFSLQAVAFYYFSKKQYSIQYEFGRIFKLLIIAILFYLGSMQAAFSSVWINLIIKLSLLVIFLFIFYYSRILSMQEKEIIKRIYKTVMNKIRGKKEPVNLTIIDKR